MALSTPGSTRMLVTSLAWTAVPAVSILTLAMAGGQLVDAVRYLAVWVLFVLTPGGLLWRALAGARSLAQDLGFGSVLGMAWALAGWAVCTALGEPRLQWLLSGGLVLAFALVPRLRRHVTLSGGVPAEPAGRHLLLAGLLVLVALRTFVVVLRQTPLPPKAFAQNQDIWHQLGIVQQLRHSVVPEDPAVAGEPLIYHWFANALMACQSVLADVDPPQVLIRYWPATMALTLLMVGWAAGQELAGRWWAGPPAGILTALLPAGILLAQGHPVEMSGPLQIQGPTGLLAGAVLLGLTGPVARILRGESTAGTWVAAALMVALAAGTKPTLLPILLTGCLVAGLALWIMRRRPPWPAVALVGLIAVFWPLALFVLTGSTGGSRLQLFALARALPYYAAVTGDRSVPATGGLVLPSLTSAAIPIWIFVLAQVVNFLLSHSVRLLAVLGVVLRPTRRDPAFWWAAGCVTAGTGVTLGFSHVGYGEYHFVRTIAGLGAVVTVAAGARVLEAVLGPGPQRGPRVRFLLTAAAATAVAAAAVRFSWPIPDQPTDALTATTFLLGPYLATAAAAAALTGLVLAARHLLRRERTRAVVTAPALAVAVLAAAISAGLPSQVALVTEYTHAAAAGDPPAATAHPRNYLTREEQLAALWLSEHADPDDVVATNVLCVPPRFRPYCFTDAFWVSGLSGLRQYLGGWAYTPENLDDRTNRTFLRRLSPWPERLGYSLTAVRQPSPHVMDHLRRAGVRWILADRRAGPVSPRLAAFAELRYENRWVLVFELR